MNLSLCVSSNRTFPFQDNPAKYLLVTVSPANRVKLKVAKLTRRQLAPTRRLKWPEAPFNSGTRLANRGPWLQPGDTPSRIHFYYTWITVDQRGSVLVHFNFLSSPELAGFPAIVGRQDLWRFTPWITLGRRSEVQQSCVTSPPSLTTTVS